MFLDNIEDVKQEIKGLDSKDKIKLILELTAYLAPKQKAVEVKAEVDNSWTNNFSIKSLYASEGEEHDPELHVIKFTSREDED